MLPTILWIACLLQCGRATFNYNNCLWNKAIADKTCAKAKWWDPCCSGCNGLSSTITGTKLAGFGGGLCPAFSSSTLSLPSYLPLLNTGASQLPVLRSYYKPVFKTSFAKYPAVDPKIYSLLSKLPCMKKFCFPGVAGSPLSKFSCLKTSCLGPKLVQSSYCSPCSTFC